MATNKAKRSNPLAQPQRRSPEQQQKDTQQKSHLLETLRHLNRGFGIALAAFDRLHRQDRQYKADIFPQECLHDYRNRTERLRALANRDLLRFFAGREDQNAVRFSRLSTKANPKGQ